MQKVEGKAAVSAHRAAPAPIESSPTRCRIGRGRGTCPAGGDRPDRPARARGAVVGRTARPKRARSSAASSELSSSRSPSSTSDKQSARVVAGVGWLPGVIGEQVLGTGVESQAGFTLASGEPVVVRDYETESRFRIVPSLVANGARSGMSVRIGGAEAPYGTLSVFTARQVRFSVDDANFLRAVANVLAAAIARLAMERELRSSRDQLAAIVGSIDEGITVRDGNAPHLRQRRGRAAHRLRQCRGADWCLRDGAQPVRDVQRSR